MSQVGIKIDTQRWDLKDEVLRRVVKAFPEKAIEGASLIVYNIFRAVMPFRTGNMRNTSSRQVFGRSAIVRTNSGYGGFVNDGIRPSPGRFVPAIGKRIRTGMHPGFPGRFFKERTLADANAPIKNFLQNMLNEDLP